jgi:hypothetical protein
VPDYRSSGLRHQEDAEHLFAQGRHENADHLAGFAAECFIKAFLCGPGGVPVNPKGKPESGSQAFGHLPNLWDDAALYFHGRAAAVIAPFLTLLSAANPFTAWDVSDRYEAGAVCNARAAGHVSAATGLRGAAQAAHLAEGVAAQKHDVLVIRDLVGRLRLVIADPERSLTADDIEALSTGFRETVGPFSASEPVVVAEDLINSDELFNSEDRTILRSSSPDSAQIALLERTVVGESWISVAQRGERADGTPWVAMYSLKGGVGRSTAAAWIALEEAVDERCVLLVDLDLESPGVSTLLIDDANFPDYGLVDYLVEAAVHNEHDLDLVARSSHPLPGNGEVWIAPTGGRRRDRYTYIPKLNRAYMPVTAVGGLVGFPDRLRAAVSACIDRVAELSRQPDLVILDSRAGIHDIAATAVTQLADFAFLFGANDEATWAGYETLFSQWRLRPEDARRLRERLKVVAAMVPQVSSAYLSLLRDRSSACFEVLYDESYPDDLTAFNPSVDDESAPHYPLPVYFDPGLWRLTRENLTDLVASPTAKAAFAELVAGFRKLIRDA